MSNAAEQESWQERVTAELLPRLSAARIPVDVRAQTLVTAWLSRHALDNPTAGPEAARAVLKALLAKTPAEQRTFDDVFDAWADGRAARNDDTDTSGGKGRTSPGKRPGGALSRAMAVPRAWWRQWASGPWLAFAAVLVAAALTFWWAPWQSAPFKPAPAANASDADATPVRRVTGGLEQATGPREQRARPVATGASGAASASQPAAPASARPSTATPSLQATLSRWARAVLEPPTRLLGLHPLLYAILLLLLMATTYLFRRERERELARITTPRTDLREQEVYAGRRRPASGSQRAALRQAARALRRPQPAEGRTLDLPATVQASVRAAGRFEPVYRSRRAMRSYLVLIDRPRPGDARAHLAWEKVSALQAEGVPLEVWEFDRDPRWVRPYRRRVQPVADSAASPIAQRRITLASLGSRCAGMGLLVFSDGAGLLNARQGALWPWVRSAFDPWPERALLTPMPLDNWAEDEARLAAPAGAGFFVVPALTLSLPMVAHWWAGLLPQMPHVPGAPGRLPAELMGPALRWLSDVPVEPDEQKAMIDALRRSLGPRACHWLAASAAYPALSAELTAYVADVLDRSAGDGREAAAVDPDDAPLREMQALALAQLPWFRQGRMPDWWRLALLNELPPRALAAVRAALETLLHAGEAGHGDISLGTVATAAPAEASWWHRLRARQRSARLAATEPAGSPLRDVIYLGVLDGSIDQRLRLRARQGDGASALTKNPLRWLAAGLLLLSAPAIGWRQLRRRAAWAASAAAADGNGRG